jgi:uncharacterized protein YecT (DUF1311 family)
VTDEACVTWLAGGSRRAAVLLAAGAAAALLAGCSSASSSTASSASTASTASSAGATASASAASTASASTASASAAPSVKVAFVPITEPFDPGHPARPVAAPASCVGETTTLAIEQCFEDKTETADAAIDAVRQASFAAAGAGQQAADNRDDSAWLAARGPACAKAYQTGGTIDGINAASCLLDESTARLDSLKGITPPEAVLKSTDSTSLNDLSWYTTPGGSRIGLIDTQGDATGGVIIAWVVIGGADGFVVNPAQFSYRDGSFTDTGKVQGASPAGHQVAAGTVYQFSVDYSRLGADPGAAKGSGGWVYAPGAPAAVWR